MLESDKDKLDIKYEYLPGILFIDEQVLRECSVLYSNHYGKWNAASGKEGRRVSLSVGRLKEWLAKESTAIYIARHSDKIVGYAIALRRKNGCGTISWITQLVVHTEYRNKTVAKQLLQYVWGFSRDYAWGIVSANPYAVRALESATHRKCDPKRIKKDRDKIVKIGREYVPYINEHTELLISDSESLINTDFQLDHSDIPSMLETVKEKSGWNLGNIRDGLEWFAFTFQDQPTTAYTEKEEEQILLNADKYVKDAYSRMNLASENQHWMKYTRYEVDFIIKECHLSFGDTVLDIGCGTGRHSLELAKYGINAVAADYLDNHFNNYEVSQSWGGVHSVSFFCDDCRFLTVVPQQQFKAVICLYDVIGSYTDPEDNRKILQQIYDRLEPNGTAIISVMNSAAVSLDKIKPFSFGELISLGSSSVMEKTGDVFNADYLLADKNTGVFYRKETFERGDKNPPVELIVRDKRFTKDEIKAMCEAAGLTVEFVRYVNAGDWRETLFNNSSSKEILIKCRKLQ